MDMVSAITLLALGALVPLAQLTCVPRDYGYGGTVCVCNATFCDFYDPPSKAKYPKVVVYTSNLAGLRFHKTTATFRNVSIEYPVDINIARYRTYQKVYGFGGAFTDAVGINIGELTDDAKDNLMRSYFPKEGLEYNLCRIPIGGTDFSLEAYSYDDGEPDPSLKRFALNSADFKYKIPYIKAALNISRSGLQFFASAWTAPTWMKTNGKLVGGTIKPEMYQTWADYYVKFFDSYKKHGIKFWGVTTGNEPSLAKFPLVMLSKISSVGWTSSALADWVASALGPTLHKRGYGNLNILALDDQRYYLPWFMDFVFRNKVAKDYINGTAVHWYWDTIFPASWLEKLHNNFPDKFILSTEACKGFFLGRGVKLGSWERGEDYAQDIIEDMRNWVIGWVDWNMALNLTGGPTFINNVVDSPIVVNASANEFYKQPMYYAIGHFSKFVPRNSIRIDSSQSSKVSSIAFRRPDKGVVVIILNRSKYDQNITVADETKGILTLNVTAHSLTSLVYW